MKSIIILISIFLVNLAHGSIDQAPPAFKYKNGMATFVDFEKAHYDLQTQRVKYSIKVTSKIVFNMPTEGYPLFDLVQSIQSAKLDGKVVKISEIFSPDKVTQYRVIDEKIPSGKHTLEVIHYQNHNVFTDGAHIETAFWMSDFTNRGFLEAYLPSNLEYDQFEIEIDVDLRAAKIAGYHELYTNGDIIEISRNLWNIKTPDYFNTSSLFFHIIPSRSIQSEENYTYKSKLKNGNDFEVTIYSKEKGLAGFIRSKTDQILDELEKTWGPWPHPKLIVYAEDTTIGGMEYHGATITGPRALRHELVHSYFARGVMPANGNAGWIDEAIARWSDYLFFQNKKTSFKYSEVAAGSPYQRTTHKNSYTLGSNFLGYISSKFKDRGSQIKFLRKFFEDNLFKTITTKDFEEALSRFLGEDLRKDFNQYIFSKTPKKTPKADPKKKLNKKKSPAINKLVLF